MEINPALPFPLIIASGASQLSIDYYANALRLPKDTIKLFPEIVAEKLGGYSLNIAKAGLSNRNILRKALYECIKQLDNNPGQRTIVLIELTFDLRKDVWMSYNSDFTSVQFARGNDWWKNRTKEPDEDLLNSMDKNYFSKWVQVNQYFYSPYAESIELAMDLINFIGFMKSNNIEYLIFRGTPSQTLAEDHRLDTFNSVLEKDNNVFDLKNFSFTNWCVERNYTPIDMFDHPLIGHPSLPAHEAFGEFLTEKLNKRL